MTSTFGRPSLSIFWPCRTLAMTAPRVCLRATIREFPPVFIFGHETHANTGLLAGTQASQGNTVLGIMTDHGTLVIGWAYAHDYNLVWCRAGTCSTAFTIACLA
jgi:hypothetical protein